MNYTVSVIQEESRRGEDEGKGKKKKLCNDNKKSKFLAKRTGISSPPSRETHLHINSVLAGSGRVFVRLMVHITDMLLLLVAVVGIF
jgi:hypothetical protein